MVLQFLSMLLAANVYASHLPILSGVNLVDGKNISVTLADKPTVVLFISARCPCSNSHMEELKTLASENPDVQFVGVHSNSEEPLVEAQTYFQNKAMNFPVIEDVDYKIADVFKANRTPHAFLVKGPIILFRGGVSDSQEFSSAKKKYLRTALENLKSGQKIETSESRPLGCAITRK